MLSSTLFLLYRAFIGWCDNEVGLYPFGSRTGHKEEYEYGRFGSGHYTQVSFLPNSYLRDLFVLMPCFTCTDAVFLRRAFVHEGKISII